MNMVHGFVLEREEDIRELKTRARLYRHVKTGAELLSLSNDDENKVFGITFRTPPPDSTGVAHILEHSVLCGSRKYPVKEPFVELLKGSLQTFLNAFTYPDKTCYPVASQNLQDFYNLIDVYLDAVFYPRITPHIFQQEGWHYEMERPEGPLTYKGVVFNEMKGAYASPDTLLGEYSMQSLFPDTPYGHDAGGNPRRIPDLTYEAFKGFHERYYHPSNARIYFCGDDDPVEHLRIMDSYLKAFDPLTVDSSISEQIPFPEPRKIVRRFMIGEGPSADLKGMVTVNWLLPKSVDVEMDFALRILEYILLGMAGSPLRKALIDSGIGEDTAGEGLGTELKQLYFSTGLKGIRIEDGDRVETLILETLSTLASKGIDPLTVEAALNTIEFGLRENNTGNFPRGLVLMLRALSTWLYGADPLALIAFEAPLERIKTRAKSVPSFFERIIQEALLKNSHRTTLILTPDQGLRHEEEEAERKRLEAARASMGPVDVHGVMENARELQRLQQTPDTPEALATIPRLDLKDLDPQIKTIPMEVSRICSTAALLHPLFTNAILYLDLGFDLHTLPGDLLPYVPLFGRALVELGTEKEDFVTLTQRISRKTGGISPQWFTSASNGKGDAVARLFLRGKAMGKEARELTAILRDVLLQTRWDNRERFRQMVLEEKARAEQKLTLRGHQMVNLRLRSHFGEAFWASEIMGGISYLFFLRDLAARVEKEWPEVLHILQTLQQILVNRASMIVNITADEAEWKVFRPHLEEFLDALPESPGSRSPWEPSASGLLEGFTFPSQVNYVGKGGDLFALGYGYHGSSQVITRYIRNAWLWDRVRVQGGAYGAFCLLDRFSGVLTFLSYRDPNLLKTLEAFDETARFLLTAPLPAEELTKAIIGAIGDMDEHLLPDAKGYTAMIRHLTGDTDEDRQQRRDEILGTGESHFRAFAHVLGRVQDQGIVKILGSPTAIEAARSQRLEGLEVRQVL